MRARRLSPYASEDAMRRAVREAHHIGPVFDPALWNAVGRRTYAPRGTYNRPAGQNVTKKGG